MIVCNEKLYAAGFECFAASYYYFKEIADKTRKERMKYLKTIYDDFGRKKDTIQQNKPVPSIQKVRTRKQRAVN